MTTVPVKIKPPHLYFTCPVEIGHLASQVSPTCKYDKRIKHFKAPFGIEQLINLKRLFPDAEIVEGKEYVDFLKAISKNTEMAKQAYANPEIYPLEELRKMIDIKNPEKPPRQHQLVGVHYLSLFHGGALFADCGVGKTATTLWDVALKYKTGQLRPSSVLIVSKLMTLFSGWHEDTEEFTYHNSLVLWQPAKSKTKRTGEKEVICDHGPKPEGESKSYEKVKYFFHTGEEAILKSARKFDPKRHVKKLCKWKQVGDVKYGEETAVAVESINIRANNIRELINSEQHDIHVINHEGLLHFEDALRARRYEYIVVDESTVIKNPKSKMFKALLRISEGSKFRRVLSGTPSPQGPQDLWSQFYFLDAGFTLGPDFDEFIQKYFNIIKFGSHEAGTYRGEKPVIRKHGANNMIGTLEYVQSRLENRTFRCRLRDVVDFPPAITRVLDIYLEDEQRKHYDAMEENLRIEFVDGKEIEVTTDLAKLLKLRQITGGFVIDKEGNILKASSSNPKMEALKSLVEELPEDEKVIIFANYKAEIRMLLEYFGSQAVAIYGDVSDKQKFANLERFTKGDAKFIICQPKSAAYGVNGLTVARYLVFYSIDHQADVIYQAVKRIERPGQTRTQYLIYLRAVNTVDEDIYESIKDKTKTQQKTIDFELIQRFIKRR